MKINDFGVLYIVATPIGNLQDMTFRAVQVLQSVDVIAAEDTRHSMFLLQHYAIKTPVISLHEHNERERAATLLERLKKGESIALISDAGTPLISDPGYFLVKEMLHCGIRIVPIPGACAAIAALSAAGLSTDKFIFEGFLPSKSKQRKDSLIALLQESRTMIFYESPHRIMDLLCDMQEVFGGERIAVMARELTKMFETIRSGSLNELVEWVKSDENQQRGEIVVLLEGLKEVASDDGLAEVKKILAVLLASLPLKQAVDIATKITGQRKNEVYELALQFKRKD
jgi:16S rRNA (cytidine1402-2'-O)-methyltransferase